jgi:hypothetical protein
METEWVSETLEVFKQLTWLSAREDFIQFIKSVSDKRVIHVQAICNNLYIQEVKAAKYLVLDVDNCPNNYA